MTEIDKLVSCDLARDRSLTKTDEQLKTALRRYQAGEKYLEPSDYALFEDVTKEDAAELSNRHQEIILEILESRGITM